MNRTVATPFILLLCLSLVAPSSLANSLILAWLITHKDHDPKDSSISTTDIGISTTD